MATKLVEVPDIGQLRLYKRKGARSIRLSVTANGEIRVSMPYWLPFSAGIKFAVGKSEWIRTHKFLNKRSLHDGQQIGKSHHLYFVTSKTVLKPAGRVKDNSIIVQVPAGMDLTHAHVQSAASAACARALKLQALSLLPQRLDGLADKHGFTYKNVSSKRLKSRWGSCDNDKNIVLNIFLMQLSWELIDYVLVHELVHTKVLRHGPPFWKEFERHVPNAKLLKKQIHEYQPIVGG